MTWWRWHPYEYVERQTTKVAGLMASPDFKAVCVFAGVEATQRQARKYARGEGRAYAARNEWARSKAAA